MFKVIMFLDGKEELQDEIFETEEEATDYALEYIGNYTEGAEVLHYHNPLDYPDDDVDANYEIIEIDEEE